MSTESVYAQPMVRITTYITKEQENAINAISNLRGTKKSELYRDAIDSFVDASEDPLDDFIDGFQNGFSNNHVMQFKQYAIQQLIRSGIHPFNFIKSVIDKFDSFDRIVLTKPRQSGLSTIMQLKSIHLIRSGQSVVYVTPNHQMVRIAKQCIKSFIETNILSLVIKEETANSLTFTNGQRIELVPMSQIDYILPNISSGTVYMFDEFAIGRCNTMHAERIADRLIDISTRPDVSFYVATTPTNKYRKDETTGHSIPTPTYKLWQFSSYTYTPVRSVKITWDADSSRNKAWRDTMIATVGNASYQSNYSGEFIDMDRFVDVIDGTEDV